MRDHKSGPAKVLVFIENFSKLDFIISKILFTSNFFQSKIMKCRSRKQIIDLCSMYHLPRDVGFGLTSQKLFSKSLKFHISLPSVSNDRKFSKHYALCWILSQDVNHKVNFIKIISKLLMN